jgi:tetratricopeptide (TPR) repeat protein
LIKKEPQFLSAYPLLADTYRRLGKTEEALKCYFDFALASEKRGDFKSLASSYIGIGWLYQGRAEFPKAFEFYQQALNLSREKSDKLHEAEALRKLAVWSIDKDDYNKALELLLQSLEINRAKERIPAYRYNLACDYFDIGLVYSNKDDFSTAKEFYAKSKAIFEKLRLKSELSDYYFNLGEIYLFEKEYQKARDFYQQGLAIDTKHMHKPNLVSDYAMLGELFVEMGAFKEAEDSFLESVLIAEEINAPLELASGYHNLGLLYKLKNQRSRGRDFLRQAQEIYRRVGSPEYQTIKEELLGLDH